jgi:membrane-associated phospholipid phosphatase
VLAVRASSGHILAADVQMSEAIQDLPAFFGGLFRFENWLGDGTPLALLTIVSALVFFSAKRVLEGALLVLSFALRLANVLVKVVVAEPRPIATVLRITYPHDNLSYTSGHVVGVTLVCAMLILFIPKLNWPRAVVLAVQALCTAYICSIGLARIWIGAHWPSDVLGGYLFCLVLLIPIAVVTAQSHPASAAPPSVPQP